MIGLYSSAQSPEENLRNLKIELPKAGASVASYVNARTAIGVNTLPMNIAVEVEMVVEIE